MAPLHPQSPIDITDASALDLARMIREREVSPVEVTQAFLDRIDAINPRFNAYVTVTADRAMAEAHLAGTRVMAGSVGDLVLLHGVPVSIKELSDVAGVRTTYGSPAFADHVPTRNGEVVDRLFQAGAIMLGKTNAPEFGLHGTTEESYFGPTRNPWNPAHSPGGSSGGAAAALAARLCPLAEGSDGGGSIRGPGACCGVVGLKPSRARLSPAPATGEAWAGLATSGPMARSVADIALAMDVMAGPAVGDPYYTPNPAKSYLSAVDEPIRALRIGWTATHPVYPVAPEVSRAVERTAEALRARGHTLVEAYPDTSEMWSPFLRIIDAHTGTMDIPDLTKLLPHARETWERGQRLSARDYLKTEIELFRTARRVIGWFEEFDLLLCPTVTRTAPKLGEMAGAGMGVWDKLEGFICFEYWVNMAGLPGISLPLAWSDAGMPIGVQLVGGQLADRTVITVAAQLEQDFPWADRKPTIS